MLKIGSEWPQLSFQLLSGRAVPSWRDLEGRVVVMDFWATWCAPCIASIPRLNDLHTQFEKEKITFFSVTYEPPQYVREFLKEHPMAAEVVIDDSFNMFKTFQAWGIPVIFIFDSKGKLIATTHPNNLTPEVLNAALRGEVPKVKPAVPWNDPVGAESYFRKLQLELKEKTANRSHFNRSGVFQWWLAQGESFSNVVSGSNSPVCRSVSSCASLWTIWRFS